MAGPSYSRAVGQAALQAVVNSAWIAAGGLPPARRRLARFGTVAAGIAAYSNLPDVRRSIQEARADIASLRAQAESTAPPDAAAASDDRTATPTDAAASPSRRAGTPVDRPLALSQADKRRLAAVGAMLAFTMAVNFGRRRLQKRGLAHLIQDGNAYPHRALAVRIAPVAFAVELAVQTAGMYATPRKPD
jgi:hypothetical protein